MDKNKYYNNRYEEHKIPSRSNSSNANYAGMRRPDNLQLNIQ